MKRIETDVQIEATPEQVWRVLVDVAAYPAWSPRLTVEGRPEPEHGPVGAGPQPGRVGMISGTSRTVNSTLRFALELTALAALGAWGWHAGSDLLARFAFAAGAPLLAATAWGQFVAPRARRYLRAPGRLVVEAAVFGSAALALVELGRPRLAEGLVLLAVLDTALIHVWGQDLHARAVAADQRPPR